MVFDLSEVFGRKRRGGELHNVSVDEVSLVDRPANRRPILLYKNADGRREPDLSVLSDAELLAAHGALHKGLGDELMDKCKVCGLAVGSMDAFCPNCGNQLKRESPNRDSGDPGAARCWKCGAPTSGKYCSQCGTELSETRPGELAKVFKSEEAARLLKSASDSERKQALQLLLKASGLDGASLAAVEDLALDCGFDAEVIKSFESAAQQAAVSTYASLHGHSRNPYAARKAAVSKVSGVSKSAGGSSWLAIERAANELIAKSSEKLTKEQAVCRVCEQNPELYLAYTREMAAL